MNIFFVGVGVGVLVATLRVINVDVGVLNVDVGVPSIDTISLCRGRHHL